METQSFPYFVLENLSHGMYAVRQIEKLVHRMWKLKDTNQNKFLEGNSQNINPFLKIEAVYILNQRDLVYSCANSTANPFEVCNVSLDYVE